MESACTWQCSFRDDNIITRLLWLNSCWPSVETQIKQIGSLKHQLNCDSSVGRVNYNVFMMHTKDRKRCEKYTIEISINTACSWMYLQHIQERVEINIWVSRKEYQAANVISRQTCSLWTFRLGQALFTRYHWDISWTFFLGAARLNSTSSLVCLIHCMFDE